MGYCQSVCVGSQYRELYRDTGLGRHGLGAPGGTTRSSTAMIRSTVRATQPRRPTTRRVAARAGVRRHSGRHGWCTLRHGRVEGHDMAGRGLRHGTQRALCMQPGHSAHAVCA